MTKKDGIEDRASDYDVPSVGDVLKRRELRLRKAAEPVIERIVEKLESASAVPVRVHMGSMDLPLEEYPYALEFVAEHFEETGWNFSYTKYEELLFRGITYIATLEPRKNR